LKSSRGQQKGCSRRDDHPREPAGLVVHTASLSNPVVLIPFAQHSVVYSRRHVHALLIRGQRPERLVNPRLRTAMRPET
jgi:hypothetical protein